MNDLPLLSNYPATSTYKQLLLQKDSTSYFLSLNQELQTKKRIEANTFLIISKILIKQVCQV